MLRLPYLTHCDVSGIFLEACALLLSMKLFFSLMTIEWDCCGSFVSACVTFISVTPPLDGASFSFPNL